jgi:hypothetical protein
MITIKENRGFSLTFENGLTISVMIGSVNYCTGRCRFNNVNSGPRTSESICYPEMHKPNFKDGIYFVESDNAEIAIWDNSNNGRNGRGKWLSFGYDQVEGYVPTEDIGKWIAKVQGAKDLAELQAQIPVVNYEEDPE